MFVCFVRSGNTNRGLKYFFTGNEALAGWLLDLFELHVLIQQSVQEHGHTNGFFKLCPSSVNYAEMNSSGSAAVNGGIAAEENA